MSIVLTRLREESAKSNHQEYRQQKNEQIGDTGRGTRIRTYNFIESRVKDERVRKTFRVQDIMKGKLNLIYDQA